jgi:hypothetical protein
MTMGSSMYSKSPRRRRVQEETWEWRSSLQPSLGLCCGRIGETLPQLRICTRLARQLSRVAYGAWATLYDDGGAWWQK